MHQQLPASGRVNLVHILAVIKKQMHLLLFAVAHDKDAAPRVIPSGPVKEGYNFLVRGGINEVLGLQRLVVRLVVIELLLCQGCPAQRIDREFSAVELHELGRITDTNPCHSCPSFGARSRALVREAELWCAKPRFLREAEVFVREAELLCAKPSFLKKISLKNTREETAAFALRTPKRTCVHRRRGRQRRPEEGGTDGGGPPDGGSDGGGCDNGGGGGGGGDGGGDEGGGGDGVGGLGGGGDGGGDDGGGVMGGGEGGGGGGGGDGGGGLERRM